LKVLEVGGGDCIGSEWVGLVGDWLGSIRRIGMKDSLRGNNHRRDDLSDWQRHWWVIDLYKFININYINKNEKFSQTFFFLEKLFNQIFFCFWYLLKEIV